MPTLGRHEGRLGKQETKVVANQTDPVFFAVNFLLALILNAANRVTVRTGAVGHGGLTAAEEKGFGIGNINRTAPIPAKATGIGEQTI